MDKQGMTVVNPASLAQRAEALETAEKAAAAAPAAKPEAEVKAPEAKTPEPEVKAPEAKAPEVKAPEVKTPEAKKAPNDPDELRKWNTKVSQENAKMHKELASIKAEQEKVYKLLSNLTKKPIDYKELAKNPESIQKLVEEERESAVKELQEQLDKLSTEAKEKDTVIEKVRRENDKENYPEWARVFPTIQKIAIGPTGQGDSRVDYTKSAGEVLDQLYELAVKEAPAAPPAAPAPEPVKTYTEAEYKAALADAIAKEKEAIAKSAKVEAEKDALKSLSEETKGGTVASAGKGAGRVPSDHLAAFKKMSLAEQRDWLIAQNQNQ